MFKDYQNVSRLEYLPAEGPALLIPLLLGTATLAGLINFLWLEAVLVFAMLYTSGFIINSYNDIEVDLRYKTHVAGAAQRIGKKNLLRIFVAQLVVAFILSIHLSIVLNTWFLIAIVIIGVFFATAYSLPPLHFKVRGVWHVISLCISAFIIPFAFFFYIVMGELSPQILVLLVGFAVTHYGIALANQTGDYLEDKAEGLTTPAVKWGLDPTLKLAKVMTTVGFGILLLGMWGIVTIAEWLPGLEAAVASTIPIPGSILLFVVISMILLAGYSVPTRGLFFLHEVSNKHAPIKARMGLIKKRMDYPKWQASGIWSLAMTSGILFAFAVMF